MMPHGAGPAWRSGLYEENALVWYLRMINGRQAGGTAVAPGTPAKRWTERRGCGRCPRQPSTDWQAQAVLHRVPPGSILFEQSETPAFAQLLVAGRVDLLAVNGTDEALIETSNRLTCCCPRRS